MHIEIFKCVDETDGPGAIVIKREDADSIVLSPGQTAAVWVQGGRYWREKPTIVYRFKRLWRWLWSPPGRLTRG